MIEVFNEMLDVVFKGSGHCGVCEHKEHAPENSHCWMFKDKPEPGEPCRICKPVDNLLERLIIKEIEGDNKL
jgi:hypothetical protein